VHSSINSWQFIYIYHLSIINQFVKLLSLIIIDITISTLIVIVNVAVKLVILFRWRCYWSRQFRFWFWSRPSGTSTNPAGYLKNFAVLALASAFASAVSSLGPFLFIRMRHCTISMIRLLRQSFFTCSIVLKHRFSNAFGGIIFAKHIYLFSIKLKTGMVTKSKTWAAASRHARWTRHRPGPTIIATVAMEAVMVYNYKHILLYYKRMRK